MLCKVKILDINVKKLSNDVHVWNIVYPYDAVKYKPIVKKRQILSFSLRGAVAASMLTYFWQR